DGPVLAADRGLGHGADDDQRPGAAGPGGGGMAAQAGTGRHGALRPGQPVHQQRLAIVPEGAPDGAEHEPPRELPRQRGGRELLQRPEKGADQAADLPDQGRGGLGRVRLHRDVLQPGSSAWFRWRCLTGRVRKALRAKRPMSVYENLGGPVAQLAAALLGAGLAVAAAAVLEVVVQGGGAQDVGVVDAGLDGEDAHQGDRVVDVGRGVGVLAALGAVGVGGEGDRVHYAREWLDVVAHAVLPCGCRNVAPAASQSWDGRPWSRGPWDVGASFPPASIPSATPRTASGTPSTARPCPPTQKPAPRPWPPCPCAGARRRGPGACAAPGPRTWCDYCVEGEGAARHAGLLRRSPQRPAFGRARVHAGQGAGQSRVRKAGSALLPDGPNAPPLPRQPGRKWRTLRGGGECPGLRPPPRATAGSRRSPAGRGRPGARWW